METAAITIPTDLTILEETKKAFANYRAGTIEAAACLFDVRAGNAWETVASSWGEYVEQELQISQSFASKLLSAYTHFCIEGNIPRAEIADIDHERLYLARKLGGSVEEQIAKARTLSRHELKLELNDDKPHDHDWIEFCSVCHIRNHEANTTHTR